MLVCMQKIDFITHFFLKILQRNSNIVILGNLGMPSNTPKMIVSIWGNIWRLSAGKKSTSSSYFPLVIFLLQRYFKFVLGTLEMPNYAHPKWYYQFIGNFCVYLQAKNQLHPPCFSEDCLLAFWPINREPEFCQIWDWWWNISNKISFHFRLFPRKTF